MASFSSLLTSLTSAGFYYEKSPRGATYTFNQEGRSLYRNQPRFPFEFYMSIGYHSDATSYIAEFFKKKSADPSPLIKSVEMPSMKIETTPLNQYNRKRLSQSKISFEPIKIVLHDVADGFTLKFWDMYYRYYFRDGLEPGKNVPNNTNPPKDAPEPNPYNTDGSKSLLENIVQDNLVNHNFGFNLRQVNNVRNLFLWFDIFQVHGGRFNQIRLVNPRISGFSHDTLNYAINDKTLEITLTIEYEYAYYVINNEKLGKNGSSKEFFDHGEFLELPALAFTYVADQFLETNNPLLASSNPLLNRIGKNVQSALVSTAGGALSKGVRRVTSSVLDGMAHISPTPVHPRGGPAPQARSFVSSAPAASTKYIDVNRSGGKGG